MSNSKGLKGKVLCSCCGEPKKIDGDFYSSQSYIHKSNGKLSICKQCIWDYVITDDNGYDLDKMRDILQMLDKPFLTSLLEASEDEAKRDNKNVFKVYMKNLGLRQNRFLRWKDGDSNIQNSQSNSEDAHEELPQQKITKSPSEIDNKNKEDVLRMLGYDPFETENESDKVYLYNRLVDFLDEGTLEDNFKLPAVIEIVKSFNQIDKINLAIAKITSNIDRVSDNVGSVNSLITAKEKMLKSVLALAKDNGISVNHNNNKSKGAGTLSGIIKSLQEKGIQSAEVNVYDIETCAGMKQVADISNKSIFEQLMLNESDYSDMIKEQREMIEKYESKLSDLEEENRIIKIKIDQYEKGD